MAADMHRAPASASEQEVTAFIEGAVDSQTPIICGSGLPQSSIKLILIACILEKSADEIRQLGIDYFKLSSKVVDSKVEEVLAVKRHFFIKALRSHQKRSQAYLG